MNYLTISDSNFNNVNVKQQPQQQQQSQPQQSQPQQFQQQQYQSQQQQQQSQMQIESQQQNMLYDSMNDMVLGDYCDCEMSLFNNGYFSSSIYR